MKKIFTVTLMVLGCFLLSGCFKRDNYEGIQIYTTVYPIEYMTEVLYGNNSEVLSIYPDGADVSTIELTEKQIAKYSKAPIFIYNGLSNEKEIARNFLNQNKKHELKIIDVSYGLKYTYGVEELWLAPNNYLMLATTVKNNLQDIISNKYIKEEIDNNYAPLLEKISLMDAELRDIAFSAKESGTNTIVVTRNVFKFLEEYGFNVISLEDEENMTETANDSLYNAFKNKTYTSILSRDDEKLSDFATELVEKYKAENVSFHMMSVLTDEQRKNKTDYINLMNLNIENIKNIVLAKSKA